MQMQVENISNFVLFTLELLITSRSCNSHRTDLLQIVTGISGPFIIYPGMQIS